MLRWGVATGAVFVSLAVRAAADVLAIVFEPGSEELVSPPPYCCSTNPKPNPNPNPNPNR